MNKKTRFLNKLFLHCFLTLISMSSGAKTISLEGVTLEIEENVSSFSGRPAPLLVIAPGGRYHMRERLFEEIALAASKNGYHVVRFNWRYFTAKKEVSKNLEQESGDLIKVLEHFKKQVYIDKNRVVVMAKSFGSRVANLGAYQLANAVVLMTPNCDEKNTFAKNYSSVFSLKKPTYLVISAKDPTCDVNQIYRELPKADKSWMQLSILDGDHNFQESLSPLNQKVAVESVLNWLIAFTKI